MFRCLCEGRCVATTTEILWNWCKLCSIWIIMKIVQCFDKIWDIQECSISSLPLSQTFEMRITWHIYSYCVFRMHKLVLYTHREAEILDLSIITFALRTYIIILYLHKCKLDCRHCIALNTLCSYIPFAVNTFLGKIQQNRIQSSEWERFNAVFLPLSQIR